MIRDISVARSAAAAGVSIERLLLLICNTSMAAGCNLLVQYYLQTEIENLNQIKSILLKVFLTRYKALTVD